MLPAANEPYEMDTDAFAFAIGVVLHQKSAKTGRLRPIAFESHKLTTAET
jgi:hypothetical protein